jgi:outer membrane lipoprotein-sorting protein
MLGAALLLSAPATASPDAKTIIGKAKAAMKNAKTYQATLVTSMDMGQMGSMSISTQVKSIAGKKTLVKTTPIGKPTGMMAMAGPAASEMQIVDDGKFTWFYFKGMNAYSKRPSQKRSTNIGMTEMVPDGTYKLLSPTKVGGHPVFAIQVIPAKHQRMTGNDQKIVIYIDQATYRLKQVKVTGSTPAGPNQPAQKMAVVITVKDEKINAPIPESAFKFTPPPGAKEMQGGMGPGPMGVPGMSGPGGVAPGPR